MTFIKSAAAVAALAFAAMGAQAQTKMSPSLTGIYAGGNLSANTITDVGTKVGFSGFIGYNISPNFAVEFGAGSMGTQKYAGVNIDTSNYNASVVASFPVSPEASIFGRVGYGSLTAGALGVSASTNAALIGGGIRYNINQNLAIRAEYTRFASDTGAFSVGAQFAF